jgi:hypothetical protein
MTNTDQVSGLHVSIATQKDDQKRGMASVSVGYIHAFFFSCHVETELITGTVRSALDPFMPADHPTPGGGGAER